MQNNWISIAAQVEEDDNRQEWLIEYSTSRGMYRVSEFINNHWCNEVIFDEIEKVNTYCPVCEADRWIPDYKGYCCKCGHHLNRQEK